MFALVLLLLLGSSFRFCSSFRIWVTFYSTYSPLYFVLGYERVLHKYVFLPILCVYCFDDVRGKNEKKNRAKKKELNKVFSLFGIFIYFVFSVDFTAMSKYLLLFHIFCYNFFPRIHLPRYRVLLDSMFAVAIFLDGILTAHTIHIYVIFWCRRIHNDRIEPLLAVILHVFWCFTKCQSTLKSER